MKPWFIVLTWSEFQQAHVVAGHRIAHNIRNGNSGRHGAEAGRESDGLHLTACRGEMATAKAFDLFWSGAVGDFRAGDVGGIIEVRAVNGAGKRLIIHDPIDERGKPWDQPHKPFVLADCYGAPKIVLRGWLFAREAQDRPPAPDAKRNDWWEDPTGKGRWAYFVPHASLHDMDELKALIDAGTLPKGDA